MVMASEEEIRQKYENLYKIITERQLFESKPENQKIPYINYPTNFNFFDVNGYTLLHYACMLGNVEAVSKLVKDSNVKIDQLPLFLKAGKTPIEIALEAGHLEVVKILFERGAKCSHLFAAKVHPNCCAWFREKTLESLGQSFPQLEDGNFDKSKSSRFFNSYMDNPMYRLAELGDLETIVKRADHLRYSDIVSELLIIAASNGHQNIVDYLLSKKGQSNPLNSSFSQTAIHAAARHHQPVIVQHLLSLGISINSQNELKKTPLMLAVEANDDKMVKLLLDNDADVLLKDVFGNSVFHYAIHQNNREIVQLLLMHPNREMLLNSKNIYGFTGVDRAIDAGNEELLALIYEMDPIQLEAIKKSPHYGQQKEAINQRRLLPIMHYYLTLNYRDTEYLAITGHCKGFAFLRNFYSAREKKKYYYDNLRVISKWDGSLSTLQAPFLEESEQAKYHENLASLFEYWTQDVIFFQGTATMDVVPLPAKEIEKKFAVVAPLKEELSVVSICELDTQEMTREQIEEHLSLIKKMPAGVQFNLGSGEHATSGDVVESASYIDYHDPNFEFEGDPEQLASFLTDIIIDVKYRAIKTVTSDNKFPLSIDIFYFSNQAKDIKLDNFELFSAQEHPETKEAAENYQKNSPNHYTHLHAALLTGSMCTLEKLLQKGHCDPLAKDFFGRTIMDIALKMKSATSVGLILKYASDKLDVGRALIQLSNLKEEPNPIYNLLIKYAQPADLIALCIYHINYHNLAFVESFINQHKELSNQCSPQGESLLLTALIAKDYSIVQVLMKNGASGLLPAKLDDPFGGQSKLTSALQYAIDNNLVDFLPVILGDYSPQFLNLLECFCKNKTEQKMEVLKGITFDHQDDMHLNILSILLVSAIERKDTEFFIALVQKANKEVLDQLYDGKPLLTYAVTERNLPMVEALLEQGAAVDNQTHPGKNTALHIALKLKLDSKFVKVLIDHHAKVDVENREGIVATQLANTASEEIQKLISPSQYKPSMF